MKLDFVAVGDVMLDVRLPAPEGAVLHAPIAVRAAGSAVNAARAAARRGARAAVVGRIGHDAAGRMITDELVRGGVRALLEIDPGKPTGTVVYVGDAVVADRGANADLEAPELPETRVTLVSGYAPNPDALLRRAHGLRAFDTQGLTHEVDADAVLGPELDLAQTSARIACATHGADGATAIADGRRASARPPRVLDRSPIGAGDAFAAAFLLALADGADLNEALRAGCEAGTTIEP